MELISELQARGLSSRMVSIERLRELEEEIAKRRQSGMFDHEFYEERITRLEFRVPPPEMPNAKSIIIAATPSMQTGVIFRWNGESKTLIMPPTYVGYYALPAKFEIEINAFLAPTGYRVARTTRIPLKLLAVKSGLAEYGRNNITYVPGMGSFHHLFGFYSNVPCEHDEWRETKMLERCNHCRACIVKCPTGAIGDDRFLLYAERCLVFHNEKPGTVPFPEWIDPAWHNSLIGCMICQRYCPEDRHVKDRMTVMAEFSEEETALVLQGASLEHLPATTIAKLEQLELVDSLDLLPRNLEVLLNRSI